MFARGFFDNTTTTQILERHGTQLINDLGFETAWLMVEGAAPQHLTNLLNGFNTMETDLPNEERTPSPE